MFYQKTIYSFTMIMMKDKTYVTFVTDFSFRRLYFDPR